MKYTYVVDDIQSAHSEDFRSMLEDSLQYGDNFNVYAMAEERHLTKEELDALLDSGWKIDEIIEETTK